MLTKDLIIIGSGPAGLTAALYASRANLSPVVFEGPQPGGQLTLTTEVENFPGFPEGIQGPELIELMKKQAQRFGCQISQEYVTKVDLLKRPFTVTLSNSQNIQAKALIISTGASAKLLGLAHEKELMGRGVSACATCDGFFFKNKIVHIVGGGDTAMEESNFLTKFASKVYLIHRKDSFKASKAMQERLFKNPKVEIIYNTVIEELLYDQSGLTGLRVKNLKTQEEATRNTDGLFYAIGHHPNTAFLENQLELDKHGFIITKNGHPNTNIEGVFACGDVQDPYYRQAITAAGSGCQAAMRAERFLAGKDEAESSAIL